MTQSCYLMQFVSLPVHELCCMIKVLVLQLVFLSMPCRDTDTGYMQDDTATFTAAFHVIKETCTFSRSLDRMGLKARAVKPKGVNTGENFQGKFVWKIEHFTRLKDILKKRKITGLCVKSKRFTVGGRDCRLIVYPRGRSHSVMRPQQELYKLSLRADLYCYTLPCITHSGHLLMDV